MSTSTGLVNGNTAMKCVVDFYDTHQDKVVNNGIDGEIWHVGRDPKELRIFIIEECCHRTILAIVHQGGKKVSIKSHIPESGAVTSHAIDYHPLYVVFLDQLNDLGVMGVNIQ